MFSPWILTLSLLSVILLVGIPLSFARPLLRKGKGVRRETVHMEKGSETAEQDSGSHRHALLLMPGVCVFRHTCYLRALQTMAGWPEIMEWFCFSRLFYRGFARFSPFHFFSCLPMSSSHWDFVFASGGKYVFLVSQIFLGVQAMEINGI